MTIQINDVVYTFSVWWIAGLLVFGALIFVLVSWLALRGRPTPWPGPNELNETKIVDGQKVVVDPLSLRLQERAAQEEEAALKEFRRAEDCDVYREGRADGRAQILREWAAHEQRRK